MKAFEIINVYETLTSMAEKEMDLKTACIIAENIKTLSTYVNTITEKRDKVVFDFAERDENGEMKIREDGKVYISDIASCNNKISEIMDTELDVEIKKISKSSLEKLSLSPNNILSLFDYLDE